MLSTFRTAVPHQTPPRKSRRTILMGRRNKTGIAKTMNGANLGFEQTLWQAVFDRGSKPR
jgi:hypothetical protein